MRTCSIRVHVDVHAATRSIRSSRIGCAHGAWLVGPGVCTRRVACLCAACGQWRVSRRGVAQLVPVACTARRRTVSRPRPPRRCSAATSARALRGRAAPSSGLEASGAASATAASATTAACARTASTSPSSAARDSASRGAFGSTARRHASPAERTRGARLAARSECARVA